MSLLPRCIICGQIGYCNCIVPIFNLPHIPHTNNKTEITRKNDSLWQLCPKCHGEGLIVEFKPTNEPNVFSNACKVCDNTGLINKLSGRPPKK